MPITILPPSNPPLRALLERLWRLERLRARDHAITFREAGVLIEIFEYDRVSQPRRCVRHWSLDLPAIIRGQRVRTLEDWAMMEAEAPIQFSELTVDTAGVTCYSSAE